MTWSNWFCIFVIIATVWALLKRYESRLVLLAAGFLMAIVCGDPLEAFHQFDKSMTNGGLIVSICSAMGFAAVISITHCDDHLIRLLIAPLGKLGFFLMPACMVVTSVLFTAIPTLSGLGAAIGPTLIPLLIRSGFSPACAASVVVGSSLAGYLSPGTAHNVFVAQISSMDVMTFLFSHAMKTISIVGLCIFGVCLTCWLMKDYQKQSDQQTSNNDLIGKPKLSYAITPLLPITILVVSAIWFPEMKLSVASAMIIGATYAFLITRKNPTEAVTEFFKGMGRGYASILGIIIAAGVFAAGLRAGGLIDTFVNYLTNSNEVASLGATIGPYLMGAITGSGDAAAFAFNEAVTPHAESFGLSIPGLGYLAMMSAALGRLSSPLAGGTILLAGIACTSPMEVVKRTVPTGLVVLVVLYFVA